ncbi:hypothetical protein [Fusibacter sp. JL216-2]|uniref:hypothetical protein n=1 Tax=Fusibacter sp. JL216-2 TaxID=3071453 RepID=UPI003D32E0B1
MSRKKKNPVNVGTISGKSLVEKSANKLGRHNDLVKSGTGVHESKKTYNRKGKKNQQLKQALKRGQGFDCSFF